METNLVYLNGDYLPLNEAKISVLDRGFLFGDGVYEVIPSYSGRLFCFEEHIERLNNSLTNIRLNNPHTLEQWRALLEPMLDPAQDQYIYLQITRGVSSKRDHAFPKDASPTVFAMCSPIVPFDGRDLGVNAITLEDNRWEHCNIKATTLLANILLRQTAVEQGCAEAILIRQGFVTEGAASNVFIVLNGVLITPPKSGAILPGITRDVVLMITQQNNIAYREEAISFSQLQAAEEIWLTSSTREIIPVVNLDGKPVGQGAPGPVWHKLNSLFQTFKHQTS